MIEAIIKWGLLGVFVIFLLVGFLTGIIRGLKRSGLHIIFVVISVVLSLLLTKTITNIILGINIPIGGHPTTISQYIFDMINSHFDLSSFNSVADLITVLPLAVASPFVFMVLQMVLQGLCGIVYLIVARVSFGKKKEDFKENKPHRLLGGLVGAVEGFALMFVIFSPITSLGRTANDILYSEASASSYSVSATDTSITTPDGDLKTVGEIVSGMIPGNVEEYLNLVNGSVLSKVCSVAGLNHAMFDYLSTVKVNGEKVVLRKEFADTVEAYDNFTVVYNAVKDKDFSISGAKLEKSANKVVNAGIFKSVVAPVIRDFIVNYEEVKTQLGVNLPAIAEEVITNLQPIFGTADFDPYEYLSHDIRLVVETAKSALDDGLAEDIYDMTTSALSLEQVLTFTKSNEEALSTDIKNLLNLNMLDANFDLAMDKVTEIVQEKLSDDTIEFNRTITNKNAMVDQLFNAVDKLDIINTKVGGIESFVEESGDIITKLAAIDDIGQVLSDIGIAIDDIRELEILVLTDTSVTPHTTTYVFDKILNSYGFDLLGDNVKGYPGATGVTKLDTYKKFTTFLRDPVDTAKNLGFLDLLTETEGVTFDTVLNNTFTALKADTQNTLVSRMLLPFYQITKQEINDKVFNNAITLLGDNLGDFVDFTAPQTTDTYEKWKLELDYINAALKVLGEGDIVDGTDHLSYFKYMTKSGADIKTLMKTMITDHQMENLLQPTFASDVLTPLTNRMFNTIDEVIENITVKKVGGSTEKVNPHTSLTNLKSTSTSVAECVTNILEVMLNAESDISLVDVGKVLDRIKGATLSGSGKVFEHIFNDIIWFATGEPMGTFSGTPNNDYYQDVKAYINPTGTANYHEINYEQKFTELQNAVDFAQALSDALEDKSLDTPEHAQEFIDAFVDAIGDMEGTTEEKVQILNDIKTLITNNPDRSEILTPAEKTTYGETITDAIEDQGFDEDLENAIYNLLGL